MRSSLVIVAAAAIMLLGMLGTAVILFDEDRVKRLVIAQVERNTGRKVEILGAMTLRFFPGLQLNAEQVVLRDRDDDAGPVFLSAERLKVQLRLLPLIRGQAVADEVRLSGTRLNLQIDAEGLPNAEARPDQQGGSAQLGLTTGNIFLDDLAVDIHDQDADLRQSFAVDQVQLSGFALDRPVAFRFSGNVGDPALFDHLEVTGRLISGSSGLFELKDMRLVGSLEQGRYAVAVDGDLAFQAGSGSAFSLTGGQLTLNQHQLALDLSYQALDRPYLSAVVGGQLLEVDTMALLDQLTLLPHDPSRSSSLAGIAGLDFDVQLNLAQVGRFGLVLQDLSAGIAARHGRFSVNDLSASLPGGLFAGEAVLDLGVAAPRWQLQADVALAEAEGLFGLLWPESALSGAGRLALALESVERGDRAGGLPWAGQGHLMLWDGRWGLLAFLSEEVGVEAAEDGSFSSIESGWQLQPGLLELQSLQMAGPGWMAQGDIELSGRHGALFGRLRVSDDLGERLSVELGGRLAEPVLLAPPIVLAASQ